MPTKKKFDELKKDAKSKQIEQLEQQLIDEYTKIQTTTNEIKTERTELPQELEYVSQPYTSNDLDAFRTKLNEIAHHLTDIQLTNEQLFDPSKPVSILQFLFAGILWHNWYLNQLEANQTSGWKNVYDMREFITSFEHFLLLFKAIKEVNGLYRDDLSDLAKLTLRIIAFYYFNKLFIFDPLSFFKQMLNIQHAVYMLSFFQEELADEEEKEIASLMTAELQTKWNEQRLLLFRSSLDTNTILSTIPFTIRTMMYNHSRSISLNNLSKAMEKWMKMRLAHNLLSNMDVEEE